MELVGEPCTFDEFGAVATPLGDHLERLAVEIRAHAELVAEAQALVDALAGSAGRIGVAGVEVMPGRVQLEVVFREPGIRPRWRCWGDTLGDAALETHNLLVGLLDHARMEGT